MNENKRYITKELNHETYFIDTNQKHVDLEDYFEIDNYATMSDKQVIDLLNEEEEHIQHLDKLIEIQLQSLTKKDEEINKLKQQIHNISENRYTWQELAIKSITSHRIYIETIEKICDQETIEKIRIAYEKEEIK